MKLVKILSALAVFAAAGMMAAGCDSLAGSGVGDEAVFTETAGSVLNSAGSGTTKKIKVKFEVKNGGVWGLVWSYGIVSTQDDSYLVYDWDVCANDFYITITVPASDEYLNIRWKGNEGGFSTYVRAKMKAESGTITLDYNGNAGSGKVATKNLHDVKVYGPIFSDDNKWVLEDWENAKKRAVKD